MKPEQKKILSTELESLRERIIQNHFAAGQKASGKTAKSMRVIMEEDSGELIGRKAFGTLETGRKGGKVPAGFATIILRWAQDKGIKVDNPKSFAFLVARKIAREVTAREGTARGGTLLHRQGGRADIYSTEIPKTIDRLIERLTENQITEIKSIFVNKVKEFA